MIKSSVTDLLSGAESGEIWIKRISRLPENLPTADHKLSFLFLSAQAKILFGCSCLEQQNVLTSRRWLELLDHTKPYWDGMVPPPENRGARVNGSFYILIHPSEKEEDYNIYIDTSKWGLAGRCFWHDQVLPSAAQSPARNAAFLFPQTKKF